MPTPMSLVKEYLIKEQLKNDRIFKESSFQPLTETNLSGALYFSQKEYNILRDRGRDRCFGELADGRIVEYTEMITLDMLQEAPDDVCPFDDAVYLGMGKFHHWRDEHGKEW